MNDNADLIIANLLRVAHEDLQDAQKLAQDGSRNGVYLLEQAGEKIIKAILISEGLHAGRGHELDMLVRQIPDANPLKVKCKEIQNLRSYATTYRYVTEKGHIKNPPKKEQFDGFFNKVDALLQETAKRFDVDLNQRNLPAAKPDPIR